MKNINKKILSLMNYSMFDQKKSAAIQNQSSN